MLGEYRAFCRRVLGAYSTYNSQNGRGPYANTPHLRVAAYPTQYCPLQYCVRSTMPELSTRLARRKIA
eukprot:298166-Rhodomonas_salina.2